MHLAGFIWTLFFWEYAVFSLKPSEDSFDVFREDKFRLLAYHESPNHGSAYLFSSLLAIDKNFIFPEDEILQAARSIISTLPGPDPMKPIDQIIIYSMFEPFKWEVGLDEFEAYDFFWRLNYMDQNMVKVIFYSLPGVALSPSTMTEYRRDNCAWYFKGMNFLPGFVDIVLAEMQTVKPTTRLIILNSAVADRTIALATAINLNLGKDNLAAQWEYYSGGEREPKNFYWNLAQWYCYFVKVTVFRPELVCDDSVDIINDSNTDSVDVPDNRRLSGSDLQELEPMKLGD